MYQVHNYVVIEVLDNKYEKKRKFDELGRIVIYAEIRNKLNWKAKDSIGIWHYNEKYFILKKIEEECVFCGNKENLIKYKNDMICQKCKVDLNHIK